MCAPILQIEKFYVCRTLLEGVYVPGNTENEDERTVCKLSMSDQITTRPTFDILVNKGNGAKLVWSNWTKYSGRTPLGAISASYTGHVSLVFATTIPTMGKFTNGLF